MLVSLTRHLKLEEVKPEVPKLRSKTFLQQTHLQQGAETMDMETQFRPQEARGVVRGGGREKGCIGRLLAHTDGRAKL